MSSSTPTNSILTFPFQFITLYFGIPTLILGLMGNIFNIFVFLSLKTFRQSSCAFFLTIMSLVNIGQLSANLLTRIMITGFNIDWTESSLAFCKLRNFVLQCCALMSYTCLSLATIDQFMATSFRRHWQQFITLKKAHSLCLLFSMVWCIHGIPALLFYNIGYSVRQRNITCVVTSGLYQQYFTYGYLFILGGLLPMIVNITFGSLAYWNVRQIPYRTVPLVRRELDKQLTQMVLVQVIFTILVLTPYIFVLIWMNVLTSTGQTSNLAPWNFANFVTGMLYYWHFAVRTSINNYRKSIDVFLEFILFKSRCIKAISPTIPLCHLW